jgi:uncharacterized protein YcfL
VSASRQSGIATVGLVACHASHVAPESGQQEFAMESSRTIPQTMARQRKLADALVHRTATANAKRLTTTGR